MKPSASFLGLLQSPCGLLPQREFSWTAPVALRAPSAVQENSVLIIDVTDVMALLRVTDVVALETKALMR